MRYKDQATTVFSEIASIIESSLEASLKYADSEYISEVDAILKEIKNNTRF